MTGSAPETETTLAMAAGAPPADPRDGTAWTRRGAALAVGVDPASGERATTAYRRAAGCFLRALALDPGHAAGFANLARVLRPLDEPLAEIACLWHACRLAPEDERLLERLTDATERASGTALARDGLDLLLPLLRHVLGRRPRLRRHRVILGDTLVREGSVERGLVELRRAIALDPAERGAQHASLMVSNYAATYAGAAIARAHRRWGRLFAVADPRPHRRRPARSRLRVGFVSSNFRHSATTHFLLPVLEAPRPPGWSATLYYHRAFKDDAFTGRFERAADAWRDISRLDDAAAAACIAADRIDVLIDLNGHTSGHRLGILARGPAPVQASWLDYVNSTGVAAVDYLITDRIHVPEGEEPRFSERVLRLPRDYICYAPFSDLPVAPLAMATRGAPTFGCFGAPYKITEPVMAAWGRILARVPGARLLLNFIHYRCASTRNRILTGLAAHGVAPARVAFRRGGAHRDFIAAYGAVDVALDTFPYSSGLTACEALWMGVPIVTFPGDRFAARHATSHLTHAGLPEWVAADRDGYVDTAVAAVADPARLARVRAGLRPHLEAGNLMDRDDFLARFGEALDAMWAGR